MKPYLAVVTAEGGRVVAHLVGVVRHRAVPFLVGVVRHRAVPLPPFLYSHCLVMGEGEYEECAVAKEDLFLRMLHALTKKLGNRVAYIEFSHLSSKMFGYGVFRCTAGGPKSASRKKCASAL